MPTPVKASGSSSSKLDNIYAEVVEEQRQQQRPVAPPSSTFTSTKTASRRHQRQQNSAAAAAAAGSTAGAQPLVKAPFKPSPGDAPREVLAARKRRTFEAANLSDLLRERGLNLQARTLDGAPVSDELPLTAFDDQEFEAVAGPGQWLEGAAGGGVSARALRAERGAFEPCRVSTFDAASGVFSVAWDASGAGAQVPRLSVCFAAEDPERFADRLVAAHRARRATLDAIRYNLYVDCMPTDDLAAMPNDQFNRVLALAFRSPRLPSAGTLNTRSLINEVNLDFQRTMNKVCRVCVCVCVCVCASARVALSARTFVQCAVPWISTYALHAAT
jgi:hypothetical protein